MVKEMPSKPFLLPYMFLAGCPSGHFSEPSVRLYDNFQTPSCTTSRPTVGSKDASIQRHACWRWADNDVAVSASCRIDRAGLVRCWRSNVKGAPAGVFTRVDDNGYDACAIRDDGRAICWGSDDTTSPHQWRSAPTSEQFVAISVGRGRTPLGRALAFACGLSVDKRVLCWEEGVAGSIFHLDGEYVDMDAGNNTVCGISTSGQLRCLKSAASMNVEPKLNVPLQAVSLGLGGVGCVTDTSGISYCWGRLFSKPPYLANLGNAIAVRAGDDHVCKLDKSGAVTCIGDARPPPTIKFKTISRPGPFGGYCGISLDTATYCWGDLALTP
jgi:hypothetical protein